MEAKMDAQVSSSQQKLPERTAQETDNLHVLIDVYKHSWDLFFKGTTLYLAACSAIGAILVYGKPDLHQKLFVGIALSFGSLMALRGFSISLEYFLKISATIDGLCNKAKYESIPFVSAKKFLSLMIVIGWILFVVGLLYIAHVLIIENGLKEILHRIGSSQT
jgi:hypothetical protein